MNIEEKDIIGLNDTELFNYYETMAENDPNWDKVIFGFEKKFHIERYLNGSLTRRRKAGTYYDRRSNTEVTDEEMFEEMSKRRRIMRRYLMEMLQEEPMSKTFEVNP